MKHNFITMLDYPALAALSAVAHEGSFERAARALGITPSAISQRVRGLEERVGSILIVRGQPCVPTDIGRQFIAHVDRVRLLEAELSPALTGVPDGGEAHLTLKIAVNADSLSTWFPAAAATAFANDGAILFDLTLDDEARTADRLRSGEVVAAVTSDPEPVQGCRTILLGSLDYAACASPAFVARHFGEGVTARSLTRAPHTRWDRRDVLQARWAREVHGVNLAAPTHWVPSAQGSLDFALLGLAWNLQPMILAKPHLAAGRLVELPPAQAVEVRLYWTAARLHATSLRAMTEAVRNAARRSLNPGPPP